MYNFFKINAEENINQTFRLQNETRNYFNEAIKKNEFMSKNQKKVCIALNYIEHLLTLSSAITGCVSFASLVGIPIGITISAFGLKFVQ